MDHRIRAAMVDRRADLVAQIASLTARIAELDHWLDIPGETKTVGTPPETVPTAPLTVTRARNPRRIHKTA
jgi:hypothetical protein